MQPARRRRSVLCTIAGRTRVMQQEDMAKRPANLEQLVRKIASEIGATEAAAFAVAPDFFDGRRISPLLHVRPDRADSAARGAAMAAFKEIVSPCIQQAKDGRIEIEGS